MDLLNVPEIKMLINGRWQSFFSSLGVDVDSPPLKHSPCPACGGVDRFRFDDKNGDGTWICGGSGDLQAGDGFALLQHILGCDFRDAVQIVKRYLGYDTRPQIQYTPIRYVPPKAKANPATSNLKNYARNLYQTGTDNVAAHPYAKTKGIGWQAGATRNKASGKLIGSNADCIIVPVRDIQTGEVVAVQAINADGKKQTFGSIKGHGFLCGNDLDKALPWFVVEGWADAVSLCFHIYNGQACVFAAMGKSSMDFLASVVAEVYQPATLSVVEDA